MIPPVNGVHGVEVKPVVQPAAEVNPIPRRRLGPWRRAGKSRRTR